MELTTYQNFERRNAQDQIIRAGTWGKNTALVNGQNTGILDYIANNLDWLKINKAEAEDLLALQNEVDTHIGNTSNPHSVTKAQVGLGNVDDVKQVAYVQGVPNAGKVFFVNTAGNAALMPELIYNEGQLGYNL